MKECINDYYIENGIAKICSEFSEEIINTGKSVYEVIRVIKGVPLFIEEHLNRMEKSTSLINKDMLLSKDEITSTIKTLIERNKVYEGNIKLIFNYKDGMSTSLCYFIKHSYPSEELYSTGVDTILFHDERDNPNAKIVNVTLRERVQKELELKDAYEAILVDNDGYITEGSKSNIFLVRDEEVITAPASMVLEGVTRKVLMEIFKTLGIGLSEERVRYDTLKNFDGLFISGTSPKVLPIRKVDEAIYKSAANEVIKKITHSYDERIQEYIYAYSEK
jgi:branched-chain amino acid aminotransferase